LSERWGVVEVATALGLPLAALIAVAVAALAARRWPPPSVARATLSDEAGDHRDDLLARRLRCGADPDLLAAPENADSVGESEHLFE
jgi:hypothetical protein